jgi:hypothetical protein
MDLQQAERLIRNAWIAGLVSIVSTIIYIFIVLQVIKISFKNDFLIFVIGLMWIWWCPIRLIGIEVLLIILCIIMIVKKSRIFSVLLFGLFCLDRIMFFYMCALFAPSYLYKTLITAPIFAYFFFQGIRGTFAYHRLKKATLQEVSQS